MRCNRSPLLIKILKHADPSLASGFNCFQVYFFALQEKFDEVDVNGDNKLTMVKFGYI